ncbi:MAG: glycosyltransferase family 39 protein, partial [Anaerolineales bacterium]|nr:glycosyltransferase family 39 protein [Anaerolineales bacterium]
MNTLSRLVWLAVWIGLIAYFALTIWLGIVGLTYPYQLDYGEGIVLWFAQQLARGQPIYKGLADLPYASSNYPPVALILSAVLMPIFGDGYISGRLLNFASTLIIAALIFRIVHTETRNWRAGALSALFFLGSPYIFHWIPLFRVDLLGLAFAFGGVYLVWHFDRQPMTDDRHVSAFYFCLFTFAFLLALYTKHSLLAAPLAAFLALWMRDRRRALMFAFALGALGGAIYLALDLATRGGFTFGIVESNATVFLPEQLAALLQNFLTTFPILLLLALWGWIVRGRAKKIGVLEWYAVTAFAALALSGRVGAWENYFFEAVAVACVFFGFQVSAVSGQRSAVRFAIPLLLLLQLALMWHDPRVAADLIARD